MSSPVAVIVVNWNGIEYTRRCVTSILQSDSACGVFVVDNGSEQDEAGELQRCFPAIDTIQLSENLGYAAAVNAGVRAATAQEYDFVLILNNDVTIAPDTLHQLLQAWRTLGDKAVIAPLIAEPGGKVWSAGGTITWPWVAGEHVGFGSAPDEFIEPRKVDWASGCALFCAVRAFDEIGYLDERFFLYLEDVEWCLRAGRKDYAIWCAPRARITHEVTKTVNAMDPRIARYYSYRNFYLTGFRHAPLPWRTWLVGHLLVSLGKVLTRNALSASYRRNRLYNARTRALFDVVRGRSGKGPYVHTITAGRVDEIAEITV